MQIIRLVGVEPFIWASLLNGGEALYFLKKTGYNFFYSCIIL